MKLQINLFNNCFHHNSAKFCLNLRKITNKNVYLVENIIIIFLDFLNFIGGFQFFYCPNLKFLLAT